jgi:hypothetical protein
MDKVHVIELETDSLYLAIAGNGNKGFQDVILHKDFYMANVRRIYWDPTPTNTKIHEVHETINWKTIFVFV